MTTGPDWTGQKRCGTGRPSRSTDLSAFPGARYADGDPNSKTFSLILNVLFQIEFSLFRLSRSVFARAGRLIVNERTPNDRSNRVNFQISFRRQQYRPTMSSRSASLSNLASKKEPSMSRSNSTSFKRLRRSELAGSRSSLRRNAYGSASSSNLSLASQTEKQDGKKSTSSSRESLNASAQQHAVQQQPRKQRNLILVLQANPRPKVVIPPSKTGKKPRAPKISANVASVIGMFEQTSLAPKETSQGTKSVALAVADGETPSERTSERSSVKAWARKFDSIAKSQ